MNVKKSITESNGCKIRDEEWKILARKVYELSQKRKMYELQEKSLIKELKEKSQFESSAAGEFMFLAIERAGSVDYKSVPEIKELDKTYLEEFRKDSYVMWKLSKI